MDKQLSTGGLCDLTVVLFDLFCKHILGEFVYPSSTLEASFQCSSPLFNEPGLCKLCSRSANFQR
jgi:hypothetical protein